MMRAQQSTVGKSLLMRTSAMPMINNNMFVQTQMRMVHKRGYNDFYDMPGYIFHEINGALQSCHNVPDYAFVFEKYSEHLTDFQIGYAF